MPSPAPISTTPPRAPRSLKQRWLHYLPGLVVLACLFAGGPAAADAALAPPEQGMYENCAPRDSECLTRLDELDQMGITVVINYWAWQGTDTEITAYADHAQALGMKLIWPT